ncbi:unnamed protein product [Eruca vesicaria subsp. sativa]|uniref:Uncharacterized protein n=1 Tax=Eruca vesicaria subsp. sativa TaxID=29727 RepID=A0ABC8KVX4_ERUVS|nr:unnamed protein product [Eruca vesicaria subsp. sativa]
MIGSSKWLTRKRLSLIRSREARASCVYKIQKRDHSNASNMKPFPRIAIFSKAPPRSSGSLILCHTSHYCLLFLLGEAVFQRWPQAARLLLLRELINLSGDKIQRTQDLQLPD